jgi:hypothetical protein
MRIDMSTIARARTVPEIIEAFGGPAAFSRVVNINNSTASEMKRRGSIPPKYWKAIVSGSPAEGHAKVTYDELVEAHSEAAA